jgi:hypothetical protein
VYSQGSRWASPMSPFAIFNFIWRQNTALGDFFGDNILFIKNYFGLLSINGAGKKHRKNDQFLLLGYIYIYIYIYRE